MMVKPTLAIINAKIYLSKNKFVEAIAITDNRIVAFGSNDEIKYISGADTKILNADGKLVLPGFIDSHVHLIEGGLYLNSLNLRNAKTKEEFIKIISEYVSKQKEGTWITGGCWNHENWGGILPSKEWIDSVTPNHPIFISRIDGHIALANSLALKIAGINSSTTVNGGSIDKALQNEPTGILKDNALNLISKYIPDMDSSQEDKAIEAAMKHLLKNGITSVHHLALYDKLDLPVIERYFHKKLLNTRIYIAYPITKTKELIEKLKNQNYQTEWLKFGAVKAFFDGSLGAKTAAFFQPYLNTIQSGLFVCSNEELFEMIDFADKSGFQILTHAIGTKANHELLNIYEKIIKQNGKRDRRFRVEHAQHLIKQDIERFSVYDIIASMQPSHLSDDGCWAQNILHSSQLEYSFACNSLLQNNAKICFGSDWFVADANPLEGIYAAVTRCTNDNKNSKGWLENQKISIDDAVKAFTTQAAYASYDEDKKGKIATGYLADLIILEKNIFETEPNEIKNISVNTTIIDGKILYQK